MKPVLYWSVILFRLAIDSWSAGRFCVYRPSKSGPRNFRGAETSVWAPRLNGKWE